jgi:hypothetical protein
MGDPLLRIAELFRKHGATAMLCSAFLEGTRVE